MTSFVLNTVCIDEKNSKSDVSLRLWYSVHKVTTQPYCKKRLRVVNHLAYYRNLVNPQQRCWGQLYQTSGYERVKKMTRQAITWLDRAITLGYHKDVKTRELRERWRPHRETGSDSSSPLVITRHSLSRVLRSHSLSARHCGWWMCFRWKPRYKI